MNSELIIIHTHFHKRRTGVTRSIENIMPELDKRCKAFLYGYGIKGNKINTVKLKKYLFSSNKVVVHCHRNNEILKMLWYRFLGAKFKIISTRHAETVPSKFTKFLLGKSDRVITLTESMHGQLGIKNTKVSHGVNTDVFLPNKAALIKEVNQKNIILCAGRVRKAKGQQVLLKAIVKNLKEYKDWAIVIIGKVDKPEFLIELKQLVVDGNAKEQVYFIKETLDIVPYYQVAKISVVPSFTEGFSLVCAEAMSAANTVIATRNVGVHSELITQNKSGYLFNPGEEDKLNDIILKLIKKELPMLGEEAREEIINNWSVKNEVDKLISVYEEV